MIKVNLSKKHILATSCLVFFVASENVASRTPQVSAKENCEPVKKSPIQLIGSFLGYYDPGDPSRCSLTAEAVKIMKLDQEYYIKNQTDNNYRKSTNLVFIKEDTYTADNGISKMREQNPATKTKAKIDTINQRGYRTID